MADVLSFLGIVMDFISRVALEPYHLLCATWIGYAYEAA
jgi:hypothetical protein